MDMDITLTMDMPRVWGTMKSEIFNIFYHVKLISIIFYISESLQVQQVAIM